MIIITDRKSESDGQAAGSDRRLQPKPSRRRIGDRDEKECRSQYLDGLHLRAGPALRLALAVCCGTGARSRRYRATRTSRRPPPPPSACDPGPPDANPIPAYRPAARTGSRHREWSRSLRCRACDAAARSRIDRAIEGVGGLGGRRGDDILARQHLARVGNEQPQQRDLAGRQQFFLPERCMTSAALRSTVAFSSISRSWPWPRLPRRETTPPMRAASSRGAMS